ncbi:hypothetical protein CIP107535_02062 [Corynebacterium diphtheriae]|nr:hypothetical protein CIP107535_02062 [Corynebacterium diphtheriae]
MGLRSLEYEDTTKWNTRQGLVVLVGRWCVLVSFSTNPRARIRDHENPSITMLTPRPRPWVYVVTNTRTRRNRTHAPRHMHSTTPEDQQPPAPILGDTIYPTILAENTEDYLRPMHLTVLRWSLLILSPVCSRVFSHPPARNHDHESVTTKTPASPCSHPGPDHGFT